MSEEKQLTTQEPSSSSVQKRSQQILKQNLSLSSQHAEELETVLKALAALPFKDDIERENFFENVQRVQGYHIIQIFNSGFAPLQNPPAESSFAVVEEVNKLVDICLTFCYTSDMSKRVSFDHYMKALNFCFHSDPKYCLSTEVVHKLLKMVQIFQEGTFAEFGEVKQQTNSTLQIHGTNYYFVKLLQIFESRRHDNCLVEIIDQTIRLASEDAKIKCIQEHAVGNAIWRSEHMVSPVFLKNWMNLLTLPNVTNGFALGLARVDSLRCTQELIPLFQIRNVTYQSTICHCLRVLEEMRRNESEIDIPHDKERLDVFFNYFNHFCIFPNVTAASLKLLAAASVSNNVLKEVFDQLFCKDEGHVSQKATACDLVFKTLSFFPDGELVRGVLKFWKEAFSDDPSYQTLVYLLAFFAEGSNNELARRTMEFLKWLPRPVLLLIPLWQEFLLWFIKLFPTTFQRRPEALVFIHKATLAARVPAKLCLAYVITERMPTLRLLEWLSHKSCTEEMKTEMIWLLICSTDISLNKEFDTGVIKALSLCPCLSFSTKKHVFLELTNLATFFKDTERKYFMEFIVQLTSNQTLELMDEILFEFLDFIKRFVDRQRPKKIPIDILTHLSSLSSVSVSGGRKLKVMQLLKKSRKGLISGSRILNLVKNYQHFLKERTNEYFDVLFPTIVETLEERNVLCTQRDNQALGYYFRSADVKMVWTFVAARLISMGSYEEEIDSQCCCPALQNAWDFESPFKILKLISLVRSTAVRLARQSKDRKDVQNSSQESSSEEANLLEKYATAVRTVLDPEVLLTSEKLLLVKKMSDVVLRNPHILSAANMESALFNLMPSTLTVQSTSSRIQDLHLKFNCIVSLLDDPKVIIQLSRIPEEYNVGSLFSILCAKMSDSFSEVHLVNIFEFVCSLHDLDQAFFEHLVPLVEVAIQESTSLKEVLEYLKELVEVLHSIRSDLIPLMMFNFVYLLKNHVYKQERNKFLTEVAERWTLTLNHRVLSFLEVPRILWKVFATASSPAKKYELIARVEEILRKNKNVEQWVMKKPLHFDYSEDYIRRRIACCELEWLVFHSLLPSDDASLALDLSCLSFQLSYQRLKCLKFADVQIEDGSFKFVSQEIEALSDNSIKKIGKTPSVTVAASEDVSPATEEQNLTLTPLFIAIKVIHRLKRLLGQEEDLRKEAISVWNLVFNQRNLICCEEECALRPSFFDDYVDVFLSILAEASSLEMVLHWARLDQHHATQCSEVILKACKWTSNEDDMDKDALLKVQKVAGATLENIRKNTSKKSISSPYMSLEISYSVPCFRLLEPQLKHLGNMLENRLPTEVTTGVLGLYQNNIQAGVAVGEVVSLWSCKQQSLELVENIHLFCEGDEISTLSPAQSEFVWQFLTSFGRLCMNSCKDLLIKFKELIVLHDPEDGYGFNRLPKWRQAMIADGFPARVVNDWCAAFLMTPLEDLTSRDVDAIVDLSVRSLQFVSSVSQIITQIIFPGVGFQVKQGEGIKRGEIKERIRLARLVGEFINIMKLRKPEENPKDAVVRDIVVDACYDLCKSHENTSRKRNDLYKIHGEKLKALFTEIFGKRRSNEDGQETIQDCGMLPQTGVEKLKVPISFERESSYLHENLPSVLSHKEVYEPMLVLLRRWLSGIVGKPSLASLTLEIIQFLFSVHPSDKKSSFLEQLHRILQERILSLGSNQSLMAQLQAAGYNHQEENGPDLWSSPTVELACYLSKRESPSSRLFEKKLTAVLRRLWIEWKDILFMCGVPSIKVGEEEVCTKDLFGVQVSLKEMEEQVASVKEKIKEITSVHFNSDDLDRRVERLIRLEQQHRKRIDKLYKSANSRRSEISEEMRKFVAVWENRFLEQVKLCSERIPGCYAPNGFHSEKPVICALSVDNRILTVFKEEKGRREEIENVEVKLCEAGLYVYGLHTSGHDYVTDELWASFYKMLLEKRLVPRIVLSNESPAFDWIKKFVQPETNHPCPWKWELHNGIVPLGEDYFDYHPITAALWPAIYGLGEFLTLTSDNVSSFQFDDFKDVGIVEGKEKRTRQAAGKAIKQLQHELQLLHGDNEPIRKALAGKLTFAVKKTVKSIVDGVQPTIETVKELIDMNKLTFKHPEVEKTEESREQYAAVVIRACEHAQ